MGQGMSAAKHPYDIRNERGEYVHVEPEVRAALERMRARPSETDLLSPGKIYDLTPEEIATFPKPRRWPWLNRLIHAWMWRH